MASLTTKLKELFINNTGYWIYKKKYLPIGADLQVDIFDRIKYKPKTIFDVGANIGQTVEQFYNIFKGATIYSFEPIGSTFEELRDNTRGKNNIFLENVALGNSDSTQEVSIFEGDLSVLNSLKKGSMNTNSDAKKENITVYKLDTYCVKNNISEIDLLKIDTEGYEIQVLEGAHNYLKAGKIKMILAEVGFDSRNLRNTQFSEITEHLVKYNFNFHSMYNISNQFIKHGENFANALYVHDQLFD